MFSKQNSGLLFLIVTCLEDKTLSSVAGISWLLLWENIAQK